MGIMVSSRCFKPNVTHEIKTNNSKKFKKTGNLPVFCVFNLQNYKKLYSMYHILHILILPKSNKLIITELFMEHLES